MSGVEAAIEEVTGMETGTSDEQSRQPRQPQSRQQTRPATDGTVLELEESDVQMWLAVAQTILLALILLELRKEG